MAISLINLLQSRDEIMGLFMVFALDLDRVCVPIVNKLGKINIRVASPSSTYHKMYTVMWMLSVLYLSLNYKTSEMSYN